MDADGAFLDGRVFTGRSYAEAFLVESGRIAAVGSTDSVRRVRPVGCPVHRLNGRVVVPGLVDPHLHLGAIVRSRSGVALEGVADLDTLVARIDTWGEQHVRGPIVGRGWDEDQFVERRAPTRRDLDRVDGSRPVVLYRVCGHAAAVNSVALAALGALTAAPEVPSGRFGESADGTPDGLLYERALDLLDPILENAPGVSAPDLRRLLDEAAAVGLTTVASVNASSEEVAAVAELVESPRLPVRLRLYVRADRWDRVSPLPDLRLPGEDRSIIRGLKVITDGSLGARTAWLDAPYSDRPSSSGLAVGSDEELYRLAEAAALASSPLAVHAIGDRALGRALRLFESTPKIPAPRIEHASLVPPSLRPRLGAFRGAVVIQPHFAQTDAWIPERLGAERARGAYAWRSLLDAGVKVAGSSDAPFDSFDPWEGLHSAVEGAPWRRRHHGRSRERLTPEEAVAIYTVGGAVALDERGPCGLTVGAPADFLVVQARDLATAIAGRGREGLATWRAGRKVAVRRRPGTTRAARR